MNSGRPLIVLVLVCSLALAGVSRQWAQADRDGAAVRVELPSAPGAPAAGQGATQLSSMNSYALALLLGGLRGPLVMFLWPSSEGQKSEHNLTDFDTKVEWIRLLQPEFDTVHLYQIWNKAYNISAQMASLPNKYVTILDALEYARSIDAQKPDDINIVNTIGSLYADKLGNSTEKAYYGRRVRGETQAVRDLVRVSMPQDKLGPFIAAARAAGMDEPVGQIDTDEFTKVTTVIVPKAVADAVQGGLKDAGYKFEPVPPPTFKHEAGVKPRRLEPILDADGNLLPALVAPTHPRPANVSPDAPWYDGSTLQFLKPYEPFKYGVSTNALGYNYFRRAQMLQLVAHERHIQIGEVVIDSRPAIAMRAWSLEEGERGRRAELRLFGIDDRGGRMELELKAPGTDPNQAMGRGDPAAQFANRPDPAAADAALYAYATAARLNHDARAELLDHVRRYPSSTGTYNSHVDETVAYENLFQADHDFLEGVVNPARRKESWNAAVDEYVKARQGFELIILRYFVDDPVAAATYPVNPATGRRFTRQNIDKLDPKERDAVLGRVIAQNSQYFQNLMNVDEYHDDREDDLTFIRRTVARLVTMGRTAPVELEHAGTTTNPTVEPTGPSTQPLRQLPPTN